MGLTILKELQLDMVVLIKVVELNVSNSELMLINCLIESNQTAGSGSDGAGIYAKKYFFKYYSYNH